MDSYFDSTAKQITKTQDPKKNKNIDYYYIQSSLNQIKYIHFENKQKQEYFKNLELASDNLDIYYVIKKLKFSCEMINGQLIIEKKSNMSMLKEVHSMIEKYSHLNTPLVNAYLTVLNSLTDATKPEYFEDLKKLVYTHSLFEENIHREFYFYAINYCVRKINDNETAFNRELLDLYINGLEQKLILENNKLSNWSYSNITLLTMKLKEYELAEKYIHALAEFLNVKSRKNAVSYSLALLAFEKKDFDQSQEHLMQMDSDDVFYVLKAKLLLLQIYFEKKQFDPLSSLAESFKKYLHRNKIIRKWRKEAYLSFIKYILAILNLEPNNTKKSSSLLEAIEQDAGVVYKDWLVLKLKTQIGVN